jgi:translation initiation factor 2 alpha subunit (eIF-2alpha)
MENKIKGGKADKMSVKDIADKFNVTVVQINKELNMGKKIEHEHTTNMSKAIEIAMDHLSEFPDYYTRLAKMEKEAEKHAKKLKVNEDTKSLIKRLIRENLNIN